MTKLIATSVVRGSRQGESHGGVYLVDFDREFVEQKIDWNTSGIEWEGRGWDRGLRGIAFARGNVLIAASDELFVYDPLFNLLSSYRSPYLKHCHEISVWRNMVYLTSTGFDSVLGFDLDRTEFTWGLALAPVGERLSFRGFDPCESDGPVRANVLHLNSITASDGGLLLSGLRTRGLLRYDGRSLELVASLPRGTHNAQPFRGGLLFNDTASDLVRFVTPSRQQLFHVPSYEVATLTHIDADTSGIARQAFARGLCPVSDTVIAGGSSPSTIALHDLESGKTMRAVTLSRDLRNAIHGLAIWPY